MQSETPGWKRQLLLAVLGVIVFSGCTLGPITSPTPQPPAPEIQGPKPNVAGVWRGDVTIADCWRVHGVGPDPCDNRRDRVEPVQLNVTHFSTAMPDVDLRVELEAFVPVARGVCYGTRDSSGTLFFQGLITRSADLFDAQVTFRGHLDGDRLQSVDETIEVNVTLKNSGGWQVLEEQWRFSSIQRQ